MPRKQDSFSGAVEASHLSKRVEPWWWKGSLSESPWGDLMEALAYVSGVLCQFDMGLCLLPLARLGCQLILLGDCQNQCWSSAIRGRPGRIGRETSAEA